MYNSRRKIVIWLAVLLLIIGAAGFASAYFRSFQKLQITFVTKNTGLKAGVYRLPVEDDDANPRAFIEKDQLVREVSQDETIKLKKGKYLVVISGNKDYAEQIETINLSENPKTVTLNPTYSSAKLVSILTQEKGELHKLITVTFPSIASGYSIGEGKLYEHGDWYGTTIRLAQTEEQKRLSYTDVFRVVAHKENGRWAVKTKPPELVLSHVKYRDIPLNILKDVNTL